MLGMLTVIEVLPMTTHFLIAFVPFTCNQNHIAGSGACNDVIDCRSSVDVNKQSSCVMRCLGANIDCALS
jgi:hypothetical protein